MFHTMYKATRLRDIPYVGERLYRALQRLCGRLTGHQWSNEWGFCMITGELDIWCRWCNHMGSFSPEEAARQVPHLFPRVRAVTYQVAGQDVAQHQLAASPQMQEEAITNK